jgi:hypothetical protein
MLISDPMVFSLTTGAPQTLRPDSRVKRYRLRNTDFMQQRAMVGRNKSACALRFSPANYVAEINIRVFTRFRIFRKKSNKRF